MYFKKRSLLISILLFVAITIKAQQKNYTSLVNPFIGTGGHGHTYPGPSMPFGMMQLSPDTRLEGWDGCSGYHYSDSIIYGFSHTHLSGTGVADYCDILLMPFSGEVKWKNSEYASPFSHKNEKASPGYYEVMLNKHQIKAALTTSYRSGMHAYTFAENGEGKILLDLKHRDEVLASSLEIVNEYEVKGMRRSKSWANDQTVFFYIRFEKPIKEFGIAENDTLNRNIQSATGKNIKAYFSFSNEADKVVRLKIGISAVSAENAKLNIDTEITDFNFNAVKTKAEQAWNKELSKIEIKGGTTDQQIAFYTAMYHASLAPNIYADVNGDFRGTDLKIHQKEGFTNYSVFSLWDTFRALHPLMNMINKERTGDWINTFLAQYKYGGMLPVWELSGNETFCMIGYHAIPVIVDAYQKGIRNFDTQLALKAMTDYAESDRFGIRDYMKNGFVSNAADHESASKTVEYAYDDWCIAQFAKWIGNEEVYKKYIKRSLNYKNLFNPNTKHIHGKDQGLWHQPFNATEVNNFFTEGNAWHYSFSAQQDIKGMIELYGGKQGFLQKLQEMFTTKQSLSGRDQADVTGLIGQYAHGNEPSHHIAYLFNYAGKPWKTQELVHKICTEFYPNNPDGLIGNEDCGQMSAWFVLSALGIYQPTPGSGLFTFGTPLFDEAIIHFENGKSFTIKAKNRSNANFYINAAQLNNKPYTRSFITVEELTNGGELVFEMSNSPNKQRGTKEEDLPISAVLAENFLAVPYFNVPSNRFKTSLSISFNHIDKNASIYYSMVSNQQKATAFKRYTKPFSINNTTNIAFYAQKKGIKTAIITQSFYKIPSNKTIKVISEVNPLYTGGSKDALIDGVIGNTNWRRGEWTGYYNKNFEAIIDLKVRKKITYVGAHLLQDISPWIVYPKQLIVEISDDGINYTQLISLDNKIGMEEKGPVTQKLGSNVNTRTRFVKFKAINGGNLPNWHESAGKPSHLFIDELFVE